MHLFPSRPPLAAIALSFGEGPGVVVGVLVEDRNFGRREVWWGGGDEDGG